MPKKMCKNLKSLQFIVAGENATEMFVMDRQTYGRTDRQTQKDKTIYPLSPSERGNKYGISRRKSEMSFCDYCRSGEEGCNGKFDARNTNMYKSQQLCRIHGGYNGVI